MTPDYYTAVHDVFWDGDEVFPRGQRVFERRGLQMTFNAGELVLRPGTNRALGYMELLQILAGIFDVEAIKRVAPKADHSLFTPQMAYGPRIFPQLSNVLEALDADSATRQAIIWVSDRNDGPTSNAPCTTSIQFLLRGGDLETHVSMRSWDLVKGLTYDVVMFGGLALMVERLLGYGTVATTVTVTAGSGHVYASDKHRLPESPLIGAPGFYFDRQSVESFACGSWIGHRAQQTERMKLWALYRVENASWTRGAPEGIVEHRD